MRILGIVSRTHDAGLALLERGVPTLILEEERFDPEKHTRKFPFGSLKTAFDDRGLNGPAYVPSRLQRKLQRI
jgi:carbamoyltransferase